MRRFGTRARSLIDDILDLAIFGLVAGVIITVAAWVVGLGFLFWVAWVIARWQGII